jgi:hypothetical protein
LKKRKMRILVSRVTDKSIDGVGVGIGVPEERIQGAQGNGYLGNGDAEIGTLETESRGYQGQERLRIKGTQSSLQLHSKSIQKINSVSRIDWVLDISPTMQVSEVSKLSYML